MSIRLDGIKEEQVTDFILFYFILLFFFWCGVLPRQFWEAWLGIIIVYTEFSKWANTFVEKDISQCEA